MANLTDFIPGADLVKVGMGLIDRIIPDPTAKAAAQLDLIRLEQAGDLDQVKVQLSAIIAEANSTDPWTSRARPSFMYVMYVMLLFGIPMGIVSAINPNIAVAVATGFKAWLTAIPDSLYALFGTGYVGYSVMRTVDKVKGV